MKFGLLEIRVKDVREKKVKILIVKRNAISYITLFKYTINISINTTWFNGGDRKFISFYQCLHIS